MKIEEVRKNVYRRKSNLDKVITYILIGIVSLYFVLKVFLCVIGVI